MAEKAKKPKMEGEVVEALPNTSFKVRLSDGKEVLAYLSGKMRMNYIKVMVGDRVLMELSPDGDKARIILRK